MKSLRSLLLIGLTALAICSVQACMAGETELNPQPLPPKEEAPRNPNDKAASDGTSGGGGLGSGTPPVPSGDGGTEGGDAAGAGDR